MSWIDRLASFRKGGTAVAEAIPEEAVNRSAGNGPPLMCLVNDASGRASFKTHVFPDSASATDFVLYWFPNQDEGGLIAFWAMTYEPVLDGSADITAEPLVMVRDLSRDGVVYLFSFSDAESAQAFLRDEVQHGTDLAAMMLYWAVPVKMAADPRGNMRLTPAVPPGAVQEFEPEAPDSDMWTLPPAPPAQDASPEGPVDNSRTIFEEAPNAYTGVARPDSPGDETFELTAWMERARRKPSANTEAGSPDAAPVPSVSAGAPEPKARGRRKALPTFERSSLTQQNETEEPEVTPEPTPGQAPEQPQDVEASVGFAPVSEDLPPMFRASEPAEGSEIIEPPVPAPDHVHADYAADETFEEVILFPASPVAEDAPDSAGEQAEAPEEASADREVEVDSATILVHTNGNGHSTDPDNHDNGRVNSAEVIVHKNGHAAPEPAAVDPDAAPPTTSEAEATSAGQDNTTVDHGVDIRIDIRLESSRALKVKRWQVKEDPFDGFNSPPGRF